MNEEKTSTRRVAGLIGLAVMSSRLLGLVREVIFSALFGAGKLYDAYLAAFQIPNLLRDLFAEGALSTAFTTLFTKTWEKEGEAPAWQLANLVFTALIVGLGTICFVGIIFAPWIVQLTNFGFHSVPGKFELTVTLVRVLFPFILLVSLAAVVMGMLNARFIFGLPASASSAFNLVSIVGGLIGAYALEPQPSFWQPHFGERGLLGVCLGVLLGGVAQLVVQFPGLWKIRYRFCWRLDWKNARLRAVWSLMLPSLIAGAAVQVNVLVNGMFASEIDGGRTWLNNAFRLMQFPIGVFGVAIATATLPAVARQQARANLGAFGHTVKSSLRLAFFLTIPAAVGLAALAEPIIRLIYEHGRFLAHDTAQTALALQAYAAGLAAYAAIKIVTPCFYALNDTRTPLRISLIGIGVNLVLNFVLAQWLHFGHAGLACTTSLVALINFLQLFRVLTRQIDPGPATEWLHYLLRVSGAAVVSGGAALLLSDLLHAWSQTGLAAQVTALFLTMAGAGTFFLLTCHWLHIEEWREAWQLLQRKLKRRAS